MATQNLTKADTQAAGLLYSPDSRKAPWNVMGGDLTTGHATVAEGLKATGLDYEVAVRPLFGQSATDGIMIGAANLRTIVRPMPDGTEKVLAAVGTRFTPIQNADAFAVNDYLVSEFGAKIAGLCDFRGGGSSLLVLEMPQEITLKAGKRSDSVTLNLLTKNAHDGSSALTFALTAIRPTCTNALPAALRNAKRTWKISHTPNAQSRVSLAQQAIIASLNYADEFQAKAEEMLSTTMVDAEFSKIVERLWNVDEEKRETRSGQNRLAIQDEVKALYQTSHTLDGIRGTRWAGYNAITEWLDWGRDVKGGEVSRAEGALEGPYVRQKARVWEVFAGV